MNTVFKIFLSLSFSGSLLILALFFGKRFWKDRLSRQWQYYVWLIVVLRLLLPFGPETNLMGQAYRVVDEIFAQAVALAGGQEGQPSMAEITGEGSHPVFGVSSSVDASVPVDGSASTTMPRPDNDRNKTDASYASQWLPRSFLNIILYFIHHIWFIWLGITVGMMIRKITIYQSFVRYLNAGSTPVSNLKLLDTLSCVAGWAGIKKPVELCVNPLVSSPLLIGFFHPCIVLPDAGLSEQDFSYIALHELMHYKRRDMFFKWLVQAAVCLHWFNPLVHRMAREITQACEFSCDEAILAKTGGNGALDYGKTLLDAMAAIRKHRENFGVISFSENKQLLKERLGAIMNFQKKSKTTRIFTALLTFCILFSSAFIGVYPVAAAAGTPKLMLRNDDPSVIAVDTLKTTGVDPDISLDGTDEDTSLVSWLSELADWLCGFQQWHKEWKGNSADGNLRDGNWDFGNEDWNFFDETLEDVDLGFLNDNCKDTDWDLEDTDWDFLDEDWNWEDTDWDWENEDWDFDWDDEEEAWQDQALMEAYAAYGITTAGDSCDYPYYYQGKLVNVLLDQRPNSSFYRLSVNPEGSVNIRIIRNMEGEITGIALMTKEEVEEVLP